MAVERLNLQDAFLNTLRKSHESVTVFLVSGVKLSGCITSFDNYCILLKRYNHSQMIYKHAISTIVPSEPIVLYSPESREQQQENNTTIED